MSWTPKEESSSVSGDPREPGQDSQTLTPQGRGGTPSYFGCECPGEKQDLVRSGRQLRAIGGFLLPPRGGGGQSPSLLRRVAEGLYVRLFLFRWVFLSTCSRRIASSYS